MSRASIKITEPLGQIVQYHMLVGPCPRTPSHLEEMPIAWQPMISQTAYSVRRSTPCNSAAGHNVYVPQACSNLIPHIYQFNSRREQGDATKQHLNSKSSFQAPVDN